MNDIGATTVEIFAKLDSIWATASHTVCYIKTLGAMISFLFEIHST